MSTIAPMAGSNVIGTPFLAFNNDVNASGPRNLWDLFAAYYYGGLSLIGEWQSGFEDYAVTQASSGRVRVPVESFYVQAAYLLTGERASSRGVVQPIRPFDLRPGAVRPRHLGGRFPLELAEPQRPDLHRRAGRSHPLDRSPLHHRPGRQLVLEPVHPRPVRLATRRVRHPGDLQPWPLLEEQRPVPDPGAGVVLSRGRIA